MAKRGKKKLPHFPKRRGSDRNRNGREFVLAIGVLALALIVASFFTYLHGNNVVSFSPESRCTDGTVEGRCSLTGLYCSAGQLVEDCRLCGCLSKESREKESYTPSYTHSADLDEGESKGYIIEFKMDPYYRNPSRTAGYKNQLQAEHNRIKQEISTNLGRQVGGNLAVYGEFFDSFNGIALDVTESECFTLKSRINEIKECYPNLRVKALLDKALPVTGVDGAPSLGVTGQGQVIAVIDTGVDASHESLDDLDDDSSTNDPKVIAFKDYVNFRTEPYDDNGHGTHVSGIAAGTGGSEGKFSGVAPGAKNVGDKVLTACGRGWI